MKVFAAVTLVVFLCCLEVALSYPNPAAKPKGRPFAVAGDRPQAVAGRLQTVGEHPQERLSYLEHFATSQQSKYYKLMHAVHYVP